MAPGFVIERKTVFRGVSFPFISFLDIFRLSLDTWDRKDKKASFAAAKVIFLISTQPGLPQQQCLTVHT
jgi:hypothetical protein